jgi:hypothetical protein
MLVATIGQANGPDQLPFNCASLKVTLTATVVFPFSAAVRVTDWGVRTVPAVAVNTVEVVVAATFTEAGTDSAAGLLDVNVTVLPPARAG